MVSTDGTLHAPRLDTTTAQVRALDIGEFAKVAIWVNSEMGDFVCALASYRSEGSVMLNGHTLIRQCYAILAAIAVSAGACAVRAEEQQAPHAGLQPVYPPPQYNAPPGTQYNTPVGMPLQYNMPPGLSRQPAAPVSPISAIAGAVQALTQHIDSITKVTSMLPNGKVSVGTVIAAAEAMTATLGTDPCLALSGLGVPVTREQYDMLRQVETIEKDGSHIAMEKKTIETFPLGISVEGGIVDDIRVDGDVEFDIVPVSQGVLMLSNVRGIVVEARDSKYLRRHTAKLTDITLGRDAAGQTILDAKLTNPEKWWERMVTGHHNSRVGVTIRIGTSGQLQILSQ